MSAEISLLRRLPRRIEHFSQCCVLRRFTPCGFSLRKSHAHRRWTVYTYGRNALTRRIAPAACLLAAAGCLLVTGCKVDVHKNSATSNKDVKIETPFGGMNVQSNQTSAATLGLPTYPGAQAVTDDGDDKSANVSMGFGPWHLVVKVVHYQTSNPRSDVVTFYRKALSQFGTVIACDDDTPVGSPTQTNEGLTCNEKNGHTHVDLHNSNSGYNLRAGSPHHQWIVNFKDAGTGTRFTLVELELPINDNQSNAKAD